MRPAARAGDRGSMRTGAPGSPGRYDALRIMIIDDHEISRTAFCALLRSEGADVVADLSTGPDALAMARALRPDVVIVMNAEYVREIQTMLESMSVQCAVFVATGASHRQAG